MQEAQDRVRTIFNIPEESQIALALIVPPFDVPVEIYKDTWPFIGDKESIFIIEKPQEQPQADSQNVQFSSQYQDQPQAQQSSTSNSSNQNSTPPIPHFIPIHPAVASNLSIVPLSASHYPANPTIVEDVPRLIRRPGRPRNYPPPDGPSAFKSVTSIDVEDMEIEITTVNPKNLVAPEDEGVVSAKRKRGRPRKNPLPVPPTPNEEMQGHDASYARSVGPADPRESLGVRELQDLLDSHNLRTDMEYPQTHNMSIPSSLIFGQTSSTSSSSFLLPHPTYNYDPIHAQSHGHGNPSNRPTVSYNPAYYRDRTTKLAKGSATTSISTGSTDANTQKARKITKNVSRTGGAYIAPLAALNPARYQRGSSPSTHSIQTPSESSLELDSDTDQDDEGADKNDGDRDDSVDKIDVIPTLKRARGRPRKIPFGPHLPVDEVATPTIKRGRGRPRKTPLVSQLPVEELEAIPTVKRGRGRPRKTPANVPFVNTDALTEGVDDAPPIKKGRGRPRSIPFGPHLPTPPQPKRKRGRPRKEDKLAMLAATSAHVESYAPLS